MDALHEAGHVLYVIGRDFYLAANRILAWHSW